MSELPPKPNIYERQLLINRQRRFLKRAFPDSYEELPESDYREFFLILPYISKERADIPSASFRMNVDLRLELLYRHLGGEHVVNIARKNGVGTASIYGYQHRFAEWLGQVTTFDEIQQIRQEMHEEKLSD